MMSGVVSPHYKGSSPKPLHNVLITQVEVAQVPDDDDDEGNSEDRSKRQNNYVIHITKMLEVFL